MYRRYGSACTKIMRSARDTRRDMMYLPKT